MSATGSKPCLRTPICHASFCEGSSQQGLQRGKRLFDPDVVAKDHHAVTGVEPETGVDEILQIQGGPAAIPNVGAALERKSAVHAQAAGDIGLDWPAKGIRQPIRRRIDGVSGNKASHGQRLASQGS